MIRKVVVIIRLPARLPNMGTGLPVLNNLPLENCAKSLPDARAVRVNFRFRFLSCRSSARAMGMDLKLQTYPQSFFVTTFGVFFALLLACLLIGILAAPEVVIEEAQEYDMDTQPFSFELEGFSSFEQALGVYMSALTGPIEGTITKDVQVRVETFGDGELVDSSDRVLRFKCLESRTECQSVEVLVLPFIRHSTYRFQVSFTAAAPSWVTGVRLEWEYVNDQFTLFELVSRLAFFCLTGAFAGYFWFQLRRVPIRSWAVEQQWTSVLVVFVLGLNDPLFALSLKFWVFDLLDQVLASSFLAVILLFWLIMFDSIRTPEPSQRSLKWFYGPKFALIALFWTCLTILYFSLELLPIGHPAPIVFFVFSLLLALAYVAYLGYITLKLIPDIRAQNKIKWFIAFTLFVVVGTVCGIVFGALGPLGESGLEFLAFFGLFNFYVCVLLLMYLPASSSSGVRGLDVVSLGSDIDDVMASDLDFSSSNDFEISLSDVGINAPQRSFSPVGGDQDDEDDNDVL